MVSPQSQKRMRPWLSARICFTIVAMRAQPPAGRYTAWSPCQNISWCKSKISMAVVHLNDCKVFAAAHFLFSPFLLVTGCSLRFCFFSMLATISLMETRTETLIRTRFRAKSPYMVPAVAPLKSLPSFSPPKPQTKYKQKGTDLPGLNSHVLASRLPHATFRFLALRSIFPAV